MNVSLSKRSGILRRVLFCILGAVCLFGPQAKATFIATIDEIGSNVVVAGSGTINFTALTFDLSGVAITSSLSPQFALFNLASGTADQYKGINGPTSFGSGGSSFADSSSGNAVGLTGIGSRLLVPQGYVSNTPLSATSTYNNATLASLGVTQGIYTWTWGTGMNADSFSIYAGVPVPNGAVPETGSTLTLLLIPAGLMFLATFRSRRLISVH